jgi:hypothetical protein
MPQPRRTRTRSTDNSGARNFANRQQRKLQQIRAQIAAEAARIMATEGLYDFHAAKRKAAERVGNNERLALPSNLEVQDALISYQQLYGGEQQAGQLEKLRLAALSAMRLLHNYSPRLVGPVLDGSAGAHCRVSLHLFCDAAETLVLDFLERALPFRQEQRRLRGNDRNYLNVPVFLIEVEDCKVELVLLPTLALRQSLPSPVDGKPQRRASQAELELLLGLNCSAA